MKNKALKFIGLFLLLPFQMAHAGVILQPIGVVSSAAHFGADPIGNTINKVGLIGGVYTSGVTDFDAYVASTTHSSGGPNAKYFSDNASLPVLITLDMGVVFDMDALAIWNAQGDQAILNFEIFSDTDNDFLNGGAVSLGTYVQGGLNGEVLTHSFSSVSSQYVHLQITSSWGNPLSLEVGEFAFRQVTVPEPTILALFSIGLLGFFTRRKRSTRSC